MTVRTRDEDHDVIEYGIEPAVFLDGSSYFRINKRSGEVFLTRSLVGQAQTAAAHDPAAATPTLAEEEGPAQQTRIKASRGWRALQIASRVVRPLYLGPLWQFITGGP
ncbi:hypothetical protein HPB49_006361 [Dermacentor silvarum]|uniref:Uncharacterized protein n=1 Tax=Dermacentor silvarum TaxID=543639 RepID=A0ACB8DWH1_DERSI|nr:hypothetical protein HPB49_006361 [Dermacentor silvarum]